MSLKQDQLTESERSRVDKQQRSASRQANNMVEYAKIASELAKEARLDLSRAAHAETPSMKLKHLELAQSKLKDVTFNAHHAKTHAADADRATVAATTVIRDSKSGIPQFRKIGSKTYKRVGGMYDNRDHARDSANKMNLPKGFRITDVKHGKWKGEWLIYVLNE